MLEEVVAELLRLVVIPERVVTPECPPPEGPCVCCDVIPGRVVIPECPTEEPCVCCDVIPEERPTEEP